MLELSNNRLNFSFPDTHGEANVGVDFQRTLRIPDDDKQYSLPPGLGSFPTRKVDDLDEEKTPKEWREHGGVVIPMFQSEAMWINFHPNHTWKRGSSYPFAIKVSTGKVSALTGNPYVKELSPGNYLVIPQQPWLDGFVVDEGFIRQFIASPLGSGVSVEQQMTGEDKVGGLQIEVIPMKAEVYDKKFPKRKMNGNVLRSQSMSKVGETLDGNELYATSAGATMDFMEQGTDSDREELTKGSPIQEMSLAAGGKMKQQVFDDPFDINDWDIETSERCFVHLVNSMTWEYLTGEKPPSVPLTAADYNQRGMPWFDYYSESPTVKPTDKMKDLKSMKEMPGGEHMLPENESLEEKNVKDLSPKKKNPKEVHDGKW